MYDKYPFLIPLFIIWCPIFVLTLLIFYTPLGLKRWPVLNRIFWMRTLSIIMFLSAIGLFISASQQILGIKKIIANQPLSYWHALLGTVFIVLASNHLAIHAKDIYRYIFRPKPKTPPVNQADLSEKK